jgi:hypothetical protein
MSLFRRQDVLGGALLVLIGMIGLLAARHYPFGTLAALGPGYLPQVACVALILIGLFLVVLSLGRSAPEIEAIHLGRPLIIIGALIAFILVFDRLGLAAAVACTVIISSLAASERRFGRILAMAVCLAAASVLLFVYALSLPIPAWPR